MSHFMKHEGVGDQQNKHEEDNSAEVLEQRFGQAHDIISLLAKEVLRHCRWSFVKDFY